MRDYLLSSARGEQASAEIYRQLAARYGAEAELQTLFLDLSAEEERHAELLRQAYAWPDDDLPEVRRMAQQRVAALQMEVQELLLQVEREDLSPDQALQAVIGLEGSFRRIHVANALGFESQPLEQLFDELAGDEVRHISRLQAHLRRLRGEA